MKRILLPFTSFGKLFANVALLFVPIVNLLTAFFVLGFALESAENCMKKKCRLAGFKHFWMTTLKGVFGAVIVLVYFLIPLVILAFGFSIPALVVGVLFAYFIPSALMTMLRTETFTKAFNFPLVVTSALTGKYLFNWVINLLLFVILAVITALLCVLTARTILIPVILLAFSLYVYAIIFLCLFARAK